MAVALIDEGKLPRVDAVHPRRGISIGVLCDSISPVGKLCFIAGWHITEALGHLESQVVLRYELGIAVPELNELLLELKVPQQGVVVVRRVIDNTTQLS